VNSTQTILRLTVFTLALLAAPERVIAQAYATPTRDVSQRTVPQVVARGGGGFPALAPRSADATDRSPRHSNDNESPTYRVDESSLALNAGFDADSDADTNEPETALSSVADGVVPLESTPESSRSKMIAPLVTVGSSLTIVLALFCGLVWAGRKFGGGAAASKPLPASALTPLGHVMLDPRTKLMLVKCGRRILVLSQTASGITPITEVTHPDEVRELIASCSSEAREMFQQTLREIELEPAKGFTDSPPSTQPAPPRASSRLFATA